MSNSFPAWPRRPPLWTSVACLVSAFLAVSYGFITVRSTTPVQAAFLPAYLQSAIWSVLPPAPRFRRNTPYVHRFTLPHRASITIPPQLLYLQLQRRVFQGQSIRQLFAHALAASVSTSLLLIVIGASLDRAHESKSRAGRHIRGPQIVTRYTFNSGTRNPGLCFPLANWRNPIELIKGSQGRDLIIEKSKEAHHIQISGDTGSGKSTLIRTILYQVEERGETAIIYDPHREYLTEFYDKARGDVILNPADERCPYWPIGEEADDEAQALPIAKGLFPDHPTAQQFFLDHTRAIFAYLLAYYRPTVNELGHWMAHPEEIDKRVANTEHAHTLTVNAAPQRAGILGSLNKAGTSLRMMPSHPAGRQTFTTRQWARKRKSWIFVTSTSQTIDALRPLQGLWLDMCILRLLGEADPDAKRCWLVLDEVQKLAQLPQLPSALTEQRKTGNPIVIGFQGMAQIDAHYGKEAETMLSMPFTSFILRSKEPRASKYLSDLIGKVQIERLRETKPAATLAGGRYRSYNTERVIEPLVLDSEIQSLPDLEGYFLQPGKVVKIRFGIRPKRTVAPDLIERLIPGVQTRPLDPAAEISDL
ncbi:MAG TPA: type IV secretion system DNA-binding domain-containing protein [Nitrospiraceae bacterium]